MFSFKKEVFIVLLLVTSLTGCDLLCGNGTCNKLPFIIEDYFNCPQDCEPCDDLNQCTQSFFNYETQNCDFINMTNCCGNGACEENEECPVDCENCDDGNTCTTDYYNIYLNSCDHENKYPCCGNSVCERTEDCENCTDCGLCLDINDLFSRINADLLRSYEYEIDRLDSIFSRRYTADDSNMVIYEFSNLNFLSSEEVLEHAYTINYNLFEQYNDLLEYEDYRIEKEYIDISSGKILFNIYTFFNGPNNRKASSISFVSYACKKSILIEIFNEKPITVFYYDHNEDMNTTLDNLQLNFLYDHKNTIDVVTSICTS